MPQTVYQIFPITKACFDWLLEHTNGQWLGPSLIVEWRFVDDLVEGMVNDGLELDFDFCVG